MYVTNLQHSGQVIKGRAIYGQATKRRENFERQNCDSFKDTNGFRYPFINN